MFNNSDIHKLSRSRSSPALKAGSRIKKKFLNSALKSAKIFLPRTCEASLRGHSSRHSQTTSLFSKRRFVGREAPEDKNKIFLNNDLNTDFADKPQFIKILFLSYQFFPSAAGAAVTKQVFFNSAL